MSAHTPGPWRVYPPGHSVPGYDVCDRVVADVMTGRSASEGPSDADAALIAAAPVLLEAAKVALVRLAEITADTGITSDAAMRELSEAIIKAEGGAA